MGPDKSTCCTALAGSRRLPIALGMPSAVTTTYSKRDVRAANLFALMLFGVGIALVALGLFATLGLGAEQVSVVHVWLAAVVFLALGTAMNLKVRELARSQRREGGEKCSGG